MYDLIVIGGGVVGCAILRAATLQGYSCCMLEAQPHLLSSASGSNSGIACTGVDASPGSLERALIRDAISHFRIYCEQHNLPTRPCGSLVCLWPWDGTDGSGLHQVVKESHEAGDTHATLLSANQVLQQEPNLASSCRGACHIPGEIVVDPWLYSISLAVHARENGATIHTNFKVDPQQSHFEHGVWNMVNATKNNNNNNSNNNNNNSTLEKKVVRGKVVVNAAGIFADVLQESVLGKKASWTANPRRGQYRIYNANSKTSITHPIQPVPSQFTKGIFVFSTIYNQLVVGPTAVDQSSRTDRSIDPKTAQHLDSIIQRVIPHLDADQDLVGEYVGIRPGTDQRDYQIHFTPEKHWMAVAGIRSTGLTASLGIGNYVLRQLQCVLPTPSSSSLLTLTNAILLTPLPPVSELVREYQQRQDGCVTIQGHRYKVTHPLTRLGWSTKNTSWRSTSNSKL
jgi:glycerol-3-phosphate dehydrogenase